MIWFPWGTIAVDHLYALHLPALHYLPVLSAVNMYIISFGVFIEGCLIVLPPFLLQDNFKHHRALTNAPSLSAKVPLESFYLPCLLGLIENQNNFQKGRVLCGPRPKQAGKEARWFEGAS